MTAVIFGLFGLVVGSFLNVVILRFGKKSIGGRSECPACHAHLRWFDMVPVCSWIYLRGRCRDCHTRISIQYLLVECSTALLFAAIAAASFPLGPVYMVLSCAIVALLVCIFVYDLYHSIIPNTWVYAFDTLAFLVTAPLLFTSVLSIPAWLYFVGGPLAALPLFALWFVSNGKWMGFGDVKLALGIGWLLGPTLGVVAIFFAFVIGAVVSVCILLPLPYYRRMLSRFTPTRASAKVAGGFTMKSEVPFGPFLILSCLIIWFAILYNIPMPLFS